MHIFVPFQETSKKIAIDMLIHCQTILKNVIGIGFFIQQVLSTSKFLYLLGIEWCNNNETFNSKLLDNWCDLMSSMTTCFCFTNVNTFQI